MLNVCGLLLLTGHQIVIHDTVILRCVRHREAHHKVIGVQNSNCLCMRLVPFNFAVTEEKVLVVHGTCVVDELGRRSVDFSLTKMTVQSEKETLSYWLYNSYR